MSETQVTPTDSSIRDRIASKCTLMVAAIHEYTPQRGKLSGKFICKLVDSVAQIWVHATTIVATLCLNRISGYLAWA